MDETPVTSNEQPQTPAPVPATAAPIPAPTSLASTTLSSSSSVPSISSSAVTPSPIQDPSPNSPSISQTQQQSSVQSSQARPQFNRPWQPPSHYTHFSSSSQLSSMPPSFASSSSPSTPPVPPFSSSSSSSTLPPMAPPPVQKGGMAIGLPAHHPTAASSPSSFSSLNPPPLGQQFGGMTRGSAPAPDSTSSPGTSQLRPPIQGIQGMGSTGSFSSGPTMRPGGMSSLHHQQRPMQSSVRAQTSANSQASTSQSRNLPWMPSSGSQGTTPFPPSSFRPRSITQQLQQRAQVNRQQIQGLPLAAASQQPEHGSSSSQQQSQPQQQPLSPVNPQHEQFPPSRVAQSLTNQLQIPRTAPGIGNQKPPQSVGQPASLQPTPVSRAQTADDDEQCNRILGKRTIRELVSQIDPSEKMDPEVEDILIDIAEEFMESITTFGCSLAKHRKSTSLEAKDILLHVERTWNISLPGFGGDEIKTYRKPDDKFAAYSLS
ncbi:transcription initiation factor TFIID subunit 12 isoform X2 [Impatiens glandulifera]|uniref:transcription initiation factor TFIID subunit 12 isoform X2 n=1 Tax=Impatiens glandulifera TaxID=253017 RepID=UPI001FB0E574|nr:transcription initiation factor TFIID subunit 12 isoform X2 [Impatiens glandulifera]